MFNDGLLKHGVHLDQPQEARPGFHQQIKIVMFPYLTIPAKPVETEMMAIKWEAV